MNRRRIVIEEMGLGPVWRLRRAGGGAPTDSMQADSDSPAHSADSAAPSRSVVPESALEVAPEVASAVVDDAGRPALIARMDWSEIEQSVSGCVACDLHKTRTRTVFGVGDPKAEWLFVGEAPGADEDARGEPFVGQAGRLLDNMLAALGLTREQNVFIANVLKCRPPGNRNPQDHEVQQCEPYLLRQIELIQPKLIVALGKFAAQTLLGEERSIASARGQVHRYHGVPLIITYHPAYLLRNLADKAKAWEDLCLARRTLQALQRDAGDSTS